MGVGGARTTRCSVKGVVWVIAASPNIWASVSLSLARRRPKWMSLMRSGVGFEGSKSVNLDFRVPIVVSTGTSAMSRPWPTSTAGERIRSDSVRADCAMLSSRTETRDARKSGNDGGHDSTAHGKVRLESEKHVKVPDESLEFRSSWPFSPISGHDTSIREGSKSGVALSS